MVMEYKKLSDDEQAFENMFHYYVENMGGKHTTDHQLEFYRQQGVRIVNNRIVFDSTQHRTWFLLRWL